MTNFKKQIVSAAAAGAMFLNLATPVLAGEYVISGNGADSDNTIGVTQTNTTTVTQDNYSNVTNTVNADADSGDNDANFNTGGNVGIGTGDAKVSANIQNALNSNHAVVDCCGTGDMNGEISGNGSDSDNELIVNNTNKTTLDQDNRAYVDNNVDAEAETGENDANSNTGGNVLLGTGNAVVGVNMSTTANVNSANVGNDMLDDAPSATFVIAGNGSDSDNYLGSTLVNRVKLAQDNYANVDNDVDAEAETGENDANFNTGGDVILGTGHAVVNAGVDNALNFNHADLDCGCGVFDVKAKILGNSADAHYDKDGNTITLKLTGLQDVGQGNVAYLDNILDELEAETGENDANSNTGAVDGWSDPSVGTGNAIVETGVSNSGGLNVLGDMNFDMPEWPEIDATFDMSMFWGFFGMNVNN